MGGHKTLEEAATMTNMKLSKDFVDKLEEWNNIKSGVDRIKEEKQSKREWNTETVTIVA